MLHYRAPLPYRSCLASLACLCCIVACRPALAGNVPLADVKQLPIVARHGLIVLRSDRPLTQDQTNWLLDTAERAYLFDLKQLGWDPADPVFSRTFDLAVISRATLTERGWALGGATYADELLALNGRCLEDQQPYYTGVIAHELTHLLLSRKFAKTNLRKLGWTPTMGEGIAIENGMRFRVLNEPDLYPDHRIPASKALTEMTADTARDNFAGAADIKAHHDSDMGLLFIEFLNLHQPDSPAPAPDDVQLRLGRILAAMSKTGDTFDAAFKTEFNTPLDQAQARFVDHLRQTENHPAARFANTILIPRDEYHRAK